MHQCPRSSPTRTTWSAACTWHGGDRACAAVAVCVVHETLPWNGGGWAVALFLVDTDFAGVIGRAGDATDAERLLRL